MKIVLNPIASLLARAEQRALIHFFPDSMDMVHGRKRAMAEQVLAGSTPSNAFVKAAEIEGMTPQVLAQLIVSKPDTLMNKENNRRALIVKLRQATTGAELDQILVEQGVPLTNLVSDFRA